VPKTAPKSLRYCVRATDHLARTSSQSCAALKIS